jgi:nucleoside-diphosphate-sugar epimerase
MKIGIIGAGWLGKAFAKSLVEQYRHVWVTCRTDFASEALRLLTLNVETFHLGQDIQSLNLYQQCDCYLVNIPFSKRTASQREYQQDMEQVFSGLLQDSAKRLIFISTTSVYGNKSQIVDIDTELTPETVSAKVHVHLEAYLTRHWPKQVAIVRLAGLAGEDRHPITALCKKGEVNKANWPVNLVYRDDVISALQAVIDHSLWGQCFVLSSLEHPSKAEYYRWAAEQLNLPVPTMSYDDTHSGKTIDGLSSWRKLGVSPRYASPYDMLSLADEVNPEKLQGNRVDKDHQ